MDFFSGLVLNGDTVLYGNADLISRTLEYDFNTEKNFDYSELSKEEIVKHLTRFIANIWQVHPFGEGNTRTTAEKQNLPVNKKMTELLNLLKENPFYTYDELAKIMNCTRETVRVNLRKLETRELICRIGSDKNGHWQKVGTDLN